MKPQTAEWMEKAEGDWNAANQLNRVRKDPNYDGVCFHCQQSAEKYLKARLVALIINDLAQKRATNGARGRSGKRLSELFGSVNLGYPTGADNESIDADLSREYANTHEDEN